MTGVQQSLWSAAYALFAVEQRVGLDDIATGARAGGFPAADTHTPEWFAAAAEGSSLLDMAPELQVLPTDLEAAEQVDLSGIDLIHVYAPEMAGTRSSAESADDDEEGTPAPEAEKPRTSTQLGLLKELGGLDT